MIEITTKLVDGVTFIDNVRLLEPDEHGCHYVSKKLIIREPEIDVLLKQWGLKNVGYEVSMHSYLYRDSRLRYKLTHIFYRCYWVLVWWLYGNARFFREIPSWDTFSWRYFTPYYLIMKVVKYAKRIYRKDTKP